MSDRTARHYDMKAQVNSRSSLAYMSGLILAVAATPAMGQDLDEQEGAYAPIVVTAQRREQASVDVPISITTVSSEQLATANVQNLKDLETIAPGLRVNAASKFVQASIRGIGTGVVTSGVGTNVGLYIDGFYSPNPSAADYELMKIENIQVLKGPQGTLFGRNTTGGAILINSADPSTDTGGEFNVSYGRYNEARAKGYATFGISDRVAIDVEGQYARGDGYLTNLTTGRKDSNFENWTVRLGLKAELSDDVSVLLRYRHAQRDDPTGFLTNSFVDPVLGVGAPNFVPPSGYTTDRNSYRTGINPRFGTFNADVLQLTIEADLGFADLTSYSQYRDEFADSSQSLDHTGVTVFQLGLPIANETWSQEFLFSSKPGGPLQWTAGLFYFQNTDAYTVFNDNVPGVRVQTGGSTSTTETYAAFVDATYEFTPRLFVTAGVRYAHDVVKDARFTPAGQPPLSAEVPSISGDKFTPRIVVRYKPSDNSSIYASYSKGYKAAILDLGGIGNRVAPENIDAFEIGFKLERNNLSLESAAFYYDYKNLQVSVFKDARAQIINAANSEIYGLEGQLRYDVTREFTVNLGGAWTHARYKRFENAPIYQRCPGEAGCGFGTSFFTPPGTTLRNVTMQRSPEFTGNAGARYRTDLAGGKLSLSGNLYYTSEFFFGPSGIQFRQGGYETLALRAQWTDPTDRYSFAVWGDNVTNNRHLGQVQFNSFGIGSIYNKPVTYGVEFGAKF